LLVKNFAVIRVLKKLYKNKLRNKKYMKRYDKHPKETNSLHLGTSSRATVVAKKIKKMVLEI